MRTDGHAAWASGLILANLASTARCSDIDLSECLSTAEVPFLVAESESWSDAIQPFNQRIAPIPAAIIHATTVEHVQDAVKCAAKEKFKVSAKSGGHSYASYGLGGDDGNVIVQVDGMYGVTLHAENNTASVLPGSRLGHVATELYDQGNRAMSHGTCPGVGFGGHILHGGYGFSSHKYGLALDAMVGAKVVLADGSLVQASETENSDLFWALRGAGSSFGIVVEFQVETFESPESVTWLQPSINWDLDRDSVLAGLLAWQEFVENDAPEDINVRIFMSDMAGSGLEAVYFGPEDEARELFEPLTEPMKLNWTDAVSTGTWIEQLHSFNDRPDREFNLTGPYDTQDHHYASSLVTKHIPEDAMASFVDFWFSPYERETWIIQMDLHGGSSSAVSAIPHDATAYPHRDKLWLFQFGDMTADLPASELDISYRFLNGFMDSLKDNLADGNWGRYANYIDSELSREEALTQYYGDNMQRLGKIKAEVDPNDVFHYPQSIEPAD